MTDYPIGGDDLYSIGLGVCAIVCAIIHGEPDRPDDTNLDYLTCLANCISPFDLIPDRDTDKSDRREE